MFKGKVALLLGALCMIAAGSTSSWAQDASASASGDSTSTSTSTTSSAITTTPLTKYAKQGKTYVISNDISTADITDCQQSGVTCTDLSAPTLQSEIICDGSNGTLGNGGWQKIADNKKCFKALTMCYNVGLPAEKCYNFDETDSPPIAARFRPYANSGATYSKCLSSSEAGSDHTSDTVYKEYCLWGYETASMLASDNYLEKRVGGSVAGNAGAAAGITGDTGDDMLGLASNAAAFVEYVDIGVSNADGLKWISRSGGVTSQDMMVPMGPRNTYKDYRDFLNNPPPGVSVSNACYAANAHLECAGGSMDVPATCGASALRNFLFKPRGTSSTDPALCAVGTASNVTLHSQGGLNYSWTCTN